MGRRPTPGLSSVNTYCITLLLVPELLPNPPRPFQWQAAKAAAAFWARRCLAAAAQSSFALAAAWVMDTQRPLLTCTKNLETKGHPKHKPTAAKQKQDRHGGNHLTKGKTAKLASEKNSPAKQPGITPLRIVPNDPSKNPAGDTN